MSNGSHPLVASLTALATLALFASSATGQEIRNYGNQGSNSGGGGGGGGQNSQTVYPGQPQPQANQQGESNQRRNQQQKKGEEGDESMESYQIRIHKDSESGGDKQKADTADRPEEQMYKGIIPGKRENVDHLKEEREAGKSPSGPNRLTWIGFQPKDDKTRIFVQMARQPDYSVSREEDGKHVVISLQNAKITAGNFRRQIDTRYFDRAVQRIDTKAVGDNTVELHISLATAKSPSVEVKEDYLYVDFGHETSKEDESDDSGE